MQIIMDGCSKFLTLCFLLAALVFWGSGSFAQKIDPAIQRQKLDSIANPKITKNHALVFDRIEINTGVINEEDKPQTYHFDFTNKGKKVLVITKVATSCGCVDATFDKKPVKSGGKGRISVTFKPKGYPGALSRYIYVYTDTSADPSAKLLLKGQVTPGKDEWRGFKINMGPSLLARNDKVVFKDMPKNSKRTERIECVNTGNRPLKLKAVPGLPPHISFRTEPEVIEPKKKADLIVTVDGSKMKSKDKSTREWVVIIENNGGSPYYTLNVETTYID